MKNRTSPVICVIAATLLPALAQPPRVMGPALRISSRAIQWDDGGFHWNAMPIAAPAHLNRLRRRSANGVAACRFRASGSDAVVVEETYSWRPRGTAMTAAVRAFSRP